MQQAPWLVLCPAVAIATIVLATHSLADRISSRRARRSPAAGSAGFGPVASGGSPGVGAESGRTSGRPIVIEQRCQSTDRLLGPRALRKGVGCPVRS